jgi:glycosyltransferase involved in cell wall biosynthesis
MKSLQTETPLVSVIICVYNAGEYLRKSVQSVLDQTYRNLEVVIVNDGSTDGCMATIKDIDDPRIRILHQNNKGKPSAMNRALETIQGDYYAVHDADDLSAPRRIECQLRCMLNNPDLAAIFCGYDLIIDGDRHAPLSTAKSREVCRDDIVAFRMPSHDPTGMYRMSLVRHVRYNPTLLLGEGLDYILRIGEQFPMMVVGECLYSYRIHDTSITKKHSQQRNELVKEVFKLAAFRRGVDLQAILPRSIEPSWKGNRNADNNLASHFMSSVCDLRKKNRYIQALQTGLHCFWLHPTDFHYAKALIYALVPLWLVRHLRSVPI